MTRYLDNFCGDFRCPFCQDAGLIPVTGDAAKKDPEFVGGPELKKVIPLVNDAINDALARGVKIGRGLARQKAYDEGFEAGVTAMEEKVKEQLGKFFQNPPAL